MSIQPLTSILAKKGANAGGGGEQEIYLGGGRTKGRNCWESVPAQTDDQVTCIKNNKVAKSSASDLILSLRVISDKPTDETREGWGGSSIQVKSPTVVQPIFGNCVKKSVSFSTQKDLGGMGPKFSRD